MLDCAPSYKHWYRQALVSLISASCDTDAGERHKPEQADTTTVIPSSIHTCKHVGLNGLLSRCTWGCPFCTHSSQPCYAGFNHHAPPPALAHLPWCHLAKCQVGLKARALPHTRPPVRPSMANCLAGLSKALKFTPHAAPQPRRTNTTKQASNPQGQRTSAPSGKHNHYRDTLTYPTTASSQTLNTNTTASSELLSMTANIKNKTCYVKRCSVHHATSTAIPRHWYRQAATRTLANNTSQNKPTQQQSQTCKFASMSWKVSSHGALGVAPSARTARTVICRV